MDPFSSAEFAFLADVSASLTRALRRAHARHFAEPDGLAVLMLSEELPPAAGQSQIPAGAITVAAQLLAVESGIDDHPPSSLVHLEAGRWVTLRAERIGAARGRDDRRHHRGDEPDRPTGRLRSSVRAVAARGRAGRPRGQWARQHEDRQAMFLSPHTVQDHLKSVFGKTSTRSRRALVSLVRGR